MILIFFILFLKAFLLKCFLKSIDNVNFKLQFTVIKYNVLNNFIFFMFKDFSVLIKVILKIKLNFFFSFFFFSFFFYLCLCF